MGRFTGVAISKGMEGLLAVTLWRTYGQARGPQELWNIFTGLPELSQIGTIAAVVAIVALFAFTVGSILTLLRNAVETSWRSVRQVWRRGGDVGMRAMTFDAESDKSTPDQSTQAKPGMSIGQ